MNNDIFGEVVDLFFNQDIEKIKNMIKENKELKEKRKYDLCFMEHLKKDKEELQERIDKAIQLINHNDIMDYRVFEEALLYILGGERNE